MSLWRGRLTDGGRRGEAARWRIMCDKSQRRDRASERAKAKRRGSFCLSNFQWAKRASEQRRERISSALYASDTVYLGTCSRRSSSLCPSPLFCSPWVTHWQSRGMPLGRISKGAAAGGLEEAIVKPMSKGSAQFSPCEPTFCICSHFLGKGRIQ